MTRAHALLWGAAGVLTTALVSLALACPEAGPCGIRLSGPILIVEPAGVTGSGSATVTGDPGEQMTSAVIMGGEAMFFSFVAADGCAPGGNAQDCAFAPLASLPFQLQVECTPLTRTDNHVAQLAVFGTGSDMAIVNLSCQGNNTTSTNHLEVSPPSPIMALLHTEGSATVTVDAPVTADVLLSASVSGSGAELFTFHDARCANGGGNPCDFSADPPPVSPTVSTPLTIFCTPVDTAAHTATLTVTGGSGVGDSDSIPVTCQGMTTGGGSGVVVSPTTLDLSAAVGASATGSAHASNPGADPLQVTTAIGAGAPELSITDCAQGCTLAAHAGSDLAVTFTPAAWGDRDGIVDVSSNDAAHTTVQVAVHEHGIGAVLDAAPETVTIGPLPLAETQAVTITLHDDGNLGVTTAIGAVTAPLAISATSVSLAAGSDATFAVSCGSSTPTMGSAVQMISLTTPAAYAGSAQAIAVSCEVADTNVRVMPTAFDFGELRIGATAAPQLLTITNPTASAVSIDSIALVRDATGLAIAGPSTATQLAPGASLTATLTLATDQESDLDAPREAIAIDLTESGKPSHLELLVTGRVGTAASAAAPAVLDLGTACIGHAVSGNELLVNRGTLPVVVQAPTIDHGFTVALADPPSYPATIAAGSAARVTVTPISTALGSASGTLAWTDDAPSTYAIPVHVAYQADGTAVSPYDLAFGTLAVGLVSSPATITLENCADTDSVVRIGDVVAVRGVATAWTVESAGRTVMLAAHQRLLLAVTFTPHYADDYNASLQITVDGSETAVQLSGFGGGHPIERTFYGCGCAGGGSPARGLTLAAAVLWIIRRRRRGSS